MGGGEGDPYGENPRLHARTMGNSLWSPFNKASISYYSSQPQKLLGTHSGPKSLPPSLATKARLVQEVHLSIFQKANGAGYFLVSSKVQVGTLRGK